jgi:hypothetical protein
MMSMIRQAEGQMMSMRRQAEGQMMSMSRQAEGQMSAVHLSNSMRMLSHSNMCIDQIPLSACLALLHHQLTTC